MDHGNLWRERAESQTAHLQTSVEPPPSIGRDERRMQVRAFSFWTGLLYGKPLPLIEDLRLDQLPDFGPSSILIDMTDGDLAIPFIGETLRVEAGLSVQAVALRHVPARSLISRLTDRCSEVIAQRAAVGFEAEFISRRGHETLYRGLLLPFSSDGEKVDFVYGVINWKERTEAPTGSAQLTAAPPTSLLRVRPTRSIWRDGSISEWMNQGRRRQV